MSISIVYPLSGVNGDTITISGPAGTLIDVSKNDLFPGPALNGTLWNSSMTGFSSIVVHNGLTLSTTNGMASVSSASTFVNADVSVTYSINSPLGAPLSTPITYAGIEFIVNSNNKIGIYRKLLPGTSGQVVIVMPVVNGISIGGSTLLSQDTTGTLRIISFNNILYLVYNGVAIYATNQANMSSGTIRLVTDSTGQAVFCSSTFSNFMSNTGVLIGHYPFVTILAEDYGDREPDRIVGTLNGVEDGIFTTSAFNHTGTVGTLSGFVRAPILGEALSSGDNIVTTIQNDSVLMN